jgi:hypothetical protein
VFLKLMGPVVIVRAGGRARSGGTLNPVPVSSASEKRPGVVA